MSEIKKQGTNPIREAFLFGRQYYKHLNEFKPPKNRLQRFNNTAEAANFASLHFLNWANDNPETYNQAVDWYESDERKTREWFLMMGLSFPTLLFSEVKFVEQLVEMLQGKTDNPIGLIGTALLGLTSGSIVYTGMTEKFPDGVSDVLEKPVIAICTLLDRINEFRRRF